MTRIALSLLLLMPRGALTPPLQPPVGRTVAAAGGEGSASMGSPPALQMTPATPRKR